MIGARTPHKALLSVQSLTIGIPSTCLAWIAHFCASPVALDTVQEELRLVKLDTHNRRLCTAVAVSFHTDRFIQVTTFPCEAFVSIFPKTLSVPIA